MHVVRVSAAYRRDLNVLVSRGIWRMFRVAESEYRRTLDAHAVLDFSDLLLRALDLLRRMDDFAQSRYRLESRYHHVLVDEFQDTSRAQWELVSLLIQSWGEGAGLAHTGPLQPSIFIVGDRKQSIYAFRDADVSVLREASRYLEGSAARPRRPAVDFAQLPGGAADPGVHQRRLPRHRQGAGRVGRLRVCGERSLSESIHRPRRLTTRNRWESSWPTRPRRAPRPRPPKLAGSCRRALRCAIARRASVAPIRAGDVGILFRTRESHREFEAALERQDIRSYVYKGLGFFDADEIKDVLALIWYLADPVSDLRAAALMRSRFFGISDEALRLLAPNLSQALRASRPPSAWPHLDAVRSARARRGTRFDTTMARRSSIGCRPRS